MAIFEVSLSIHAAVLCSLPEAARSPFAGIVWFPADNASGGSAEVTAEWAATYEEALSAPDLGSQLLALRARGLAEVDDEAERQRLRWITPGAGQAMTYQRKVAEAEQLGGDAEPSAERYPMLAASIGIDGDTLEAVAAVVLAMDRQWAVVGAAIEARRLGLKRDVARAEGADELAAIDITAGWPN